MSASPSLFQERAAEIRAHAAAAMVVSILEGYINEPSSKRFAHSRAQRAERWEQLAEAAGRQADGLRALAKAPARKRVAKAPSTPSTEVPITVASAT